MVKIWYMWCGFFTAKDFSSPPGVAVGVARLLQGRDGTLNPEGPGPGAPTWLAVLIPTFWGPLCWICWIISTHFS
jgi:hypothetical protein